MVEIKKISNDGTGYVYAEPQFLHLALDLCRTLKNTTYKPT